MELRARLWLKIGIKMTELRRDLQPEYHGSWNAVTRKAEKGYFLILLEALVNWWHICTTTCTHLDREFSNDIQFSVMSDDEQTSTIAVSRQTAIVTICDTDRISSIWKPVGFTARWVLLVHLYFCRVRACSKLFSICFDGCTQPQRGCQCSCRRS